MSDVQGPVRENEPGELPQQPKHMAQKIVMVPVAQLKKYAKNSRTHSPEQIDELCGSIAEFGFTNPVLTDGKNGVIAGHGRLAAAIKLGLKVVPVIELSHLTEHQKRAYVIADNKLAEKAGWDTEILREELISLKDADFDLSMVGFDDKELESLAVFGDDPTTEFPDLTTGDKKAFSQVTFTLTNEQMAVVKEAVERARVLAVDCPEEFGNTNKNGNALFALCRAWLDDMAEFSADEG